MAEIQRLEESIRDGKAAMMRYTLVHDWMLEIHEGGKEIIKTGTGCFPEDHDHSAQEELVRRANAYDRLRSTIEMVESLLTEDGEVCPWCLVPLDRVEDGQHAPNCKRQAALKE